MAKDTSKKEPGNGNGKKPHKPYNRSYNRKRVLELAEAGIPVKFIAQEQDVAQSTISRYLHSHNVQLPQIDKFNKIKADLLALNQMQNLTIEHLINEDFIKNPGRLLSLNAETKNKIRQTSQSGRYYDNQAERLQRGESTSNVNIRVIVERADKLFDMLRAHETGSDVPALLENGPVHSQGQAEEPDG